MMAASGPETRPALTGQRKNSVHDQQSSFSCRLEEQGLPPGDCRVHLGRGTALACRATLRRKEDGWQRLISAIQLSRPENYLSIYQSGCNLGCRKCHSWQFSQVRQGRWFGPEDVLALALEYERHVTLWEPREQATAWHAALSCLCCGRCVVEGERSADCPGRLGPEAIFLSPQGFGPVRNIIAFTGGDLTCRPEFYAQTARLIKERTRLWVLIETNGYGLTPASLDLLKAAGVDAFWLDIKAFDEERHRWLTGRTNRHILDLPEQMLARGFVVEVLSLYIPEVVEADDLEKTARLLAGVKPDLPFTLLAFFPAYRMASFRSPTLKEMIEALRRVRAAGLTKIRLGNVPLFARTASERARLARQMEAGSGP